MANATTNRYRYNKMNQTLDEVTGTLKAMLVKSSYVFNPDHQFVSDLVASECDATNYNGGFSGTSRLVISTGKAWTQDDANDVAKFDATDTLTWANLGGAVNNTVVLVLYMNGTSDADSRLVAYYDTRTAGFPVWPYTTTGATLNVDANGTRGWLEAA